MSAEIIQFIPRPGRDDAPTDFPTIAFRSATRDPALAHVEDPHAVAEQASVGASPASRLDGSRGDEHRTSSATLLDTSDLQGSDKPLHQNLWVNSGSGNFPS